MEQKTEIRGDQIRIYRSLVGIYLKIVALFLIVFSLGYWARLVGIHDPTFAFDSMPPHWQAAIASLVVLQPIAALGLWGHSRWGIVVWVLVIAIEFVMYGLFPSLFGTANRLLMFYAVCLLCYFASSGLIMLLQFRHTQHAP